MATVDLLSLFRSNPTAIRAQPCSPLFSALLLVPNTQNSEILFHGRNCTQTPPNFTERRALYSRTSTLLHLPRVPPYSPSKTSRSHILPIVKTEMALEAVVFPHYIAGSGSWPWGWSAEDDKAGSFDGNRGSTCSSMQLELIEDFNVCSNSKPTVEIDGGDIAACGAGGGRKKKQRRKSLKKKEASEQQRMTHIAVERNRRKLMNDYLAVLRSLMPPSYIHKGDQASIVGSAINFIKALEHLLLSVQIQNQLMQLPETATPPASLLTYSGNSSNSNSAFAGIEVAVAEGHASVKVLSRRRPKQLLHLVTGLQSLRLSTLHLNVTAIEPMLVYSLSLKVEEDCLLSSADAIAAAVHGIVGEIQGESVC